jgi:hypothetical protein
VQGGDEGGAGLTEAPLYRRATATTVRGCRAVAEASIPVAESLGSKGASSVEGSARAPAAMELVGAHGLPLERHDEDVDAACLNLPPAVNSDPAGATSSGP